mmetsp:Transcript_4307/g.7275  ORF Transcript_4307/g.7275 Transcript_4307/m.7275 type:complete len:262 (-) Transcript_4307:645-1430(-)
MVKLLLVLHLLQGEATLQLCGLRRHLVLLPFQAVDLLLQGQQFSLHLLHSSGLFTALPSSLAFLLADLLLQRGGPLNEFLLFFGLISLGVGQLGPQLLHSLLCHGFLPIGPRSDTPQALLRGVQLSAQLLFLLFLTFFQLLFPEFLLLPATLRGLEGLVLAAVLVHLGTLLKDLWQLVVHILRCAQPVELLLPNLLDLFLHLLCVKGFLGPQLIQLHGLLLHLRLQTTDVGLFLLDLLLLPLGPAHQLREPLLVGAQGTGA